MATLEIPRCPACHQALPPAARPPRDPLIRCLHVAGPVIDCREVRRSYPHGFIVDRRQTCLACGKELVRGRWEFFHTPGDDVLEFYRPGLTSMLTRPGPEDADVPSCLEVPGQAQAFCPACWHRLDHHRWGNLSGHGGGGCWYRGCGCTWARPGVPPPGTVAARS